MRDQPNFTEEFKEVLPDEIDRIERRVCASEKFDGADYDIYGQWVPIRPLIHVIANEENYAINSIALVDESAPENNYEPHVNMFVADLREQQEHPAFVGGHL